MFQIPFALVLLSSRCTNTVALRFINFSYCREHQRANDALKNLPIRV